MAGNGPADSHQGIASALLTGFGHNDSELVTAVPGHEIRRTQFPLEHSTQLAEHSVPGLDPMAMVHESETINIEQHQRELAPVPIGSMHFVANPAVEGVEAATPR
jgi:hypothetical protein